LERVTALEPVRIVGPPVGIWVTGSKGGLIIPPLLLTKNAKSSPVRTGTTAVDTMVLEYVSTAEPLTYIVKVAEEGVSPLAEEAERLKSTLTVPASARLGNSSVTLVAEPGPVALLFRLTEEGAPEVLSRAGPPLPAVVRYQLPTAPEDMMVPPLGMSKVLVKSADAWVVSS